METFSQRYREKFSMDNVAVGLRVPLDRQYVQGSRKLAQVIFKTECVQKVKEHQLKKEIDLEQTKAHIVARQKKDEVRFAKEIRERDLEMKRKNFAYEEKRDKVQAQKDGIEKDKARDLRERHEKMKIANEKQRAEQEKKKREHEEELFMLDIQRFYDEEMAQGEKKQKELADKKIVVEAIKKSEGKIAKNNASRLRGIE